MFSLLIKELIFDLYFYSTFWHWPSIQVSISWSCCCSLSWACFHFLASTFYPGLCFIILLLFSFLCIFPLPTLTFYPGFYFLILSLISFVGMFLLPGIDLLSKFCFLILLLFPFLGMFPLPGIDLLSRFLFPDRFAVIFLRHVSTSRHLPSIQVSVSWSWCCSLS